MAGCGSAGAARSPRRPRRRRAWRRADGIDYATVDLTQEEHDRYYNNFSNGVLWPLLHTMPELMKFDRRDAQVYREVNDRMAATLQPLLRPGDLIWVHDYHLMPMAAALRARGVTNPIGFFLHVPFASRRRAGGGARCAPWCATCWRADLIGFQTENDMANFAAAAQLLAAPRPRRRRADVAGGEVRLGVFPVEIERARVSPNLPPRRWRPGRMPRGFARASQASTLSSASSGSTRPRG